jgi:hypothetical protein
MEILQFPHYSEENASYMHEISYNRRLMRWVGCVAPTEENCMQDSSIFHEKSLQYRINIEASTLLNVNNITSGRKRLN